MNRKRNRRSNREENQKIETQTQPKLPRSAQPSSTNQPAAQLTSFPSLTLARPTLFPLSPRPGFLRVQPVPALSHALPQPSSTRAIRPAQHARSPPHPGPISRAPRRPCPASSARGPARSSSARVRPLTDQPVPLVSPVPFLRLPRAATARRDPRPRNSPAFLTGHARPGHAAAL